MTMKLAAAAYPIERPASLAAWQAKISAWVADAVGQGAELLVFPEYGLMELAGLLDNGAAADGPRALAGVAALRGQVDATLSGLATGHGVHILGPSGPVYPSDLPVNRATFYGPQGIIGHQDKQIMTRWERDQWIVAPGRGLPVFDTALGRIGVLICFAGTRACEFHRGLGQLFLDIRPAGAGLVASRNRYEPELSVTVFGVSDPDGPDGYAVPCIRAAAWSYENHGTGLFGRRKIEGHLPAFPVDGFLGF